MTISKTIKDRLVDAIITAFVFAASLTWKDTLISILDQVLLGGEESIWSEIIVAVMITTIVIVLIYLLMKSDRLAENTLPFIDDDRSEEEKSS